MRVFSPEETAARLPYTSLADSIREVALKQSAVQAPPRTMVSLPEGGVLLVMPASDGEISITKLVTVHALNSARGMPTIQGEVVVMDAATGRRLGLLDGGVVTGRRTAALSLLAAREFAHHPEGPLLIVGSGTQGRSHLEAFREGLGVSQVFIASRSRDNAEALAEHARSLGMEARAVDEPSEVTSEARLIVTATTSREPVLPEDIYIAEETFIAAVGSFEPEAAELPPGLIRRSAVVVDTLEGTKEEAGDLIQAEAAGAFRWENAVTLEDALRETPRSEETVIFKSVGSALWDLASARTAFGPINPA